MIVGKKKDKIRSTYYLFARLLSVRNVFLFRFISTHRFIKKNKNKMESGSVSHCRTGHQKIIWFVVRYKNKCNGI